MASQKEPSCSCTSRRCSQMARCPRLASGSPICLALARMANPGPSRCSFGSTLSLAGAQPAPSVGRQAVTGERPTPARARPRPVYRRRSNWRGKLIPLLVLAGIFSIYSRFSESVSPSPTSSFSQPAADSTDSPQAAPTFVRQCDGRQYCSQMTSCEEATWFCKTALIPRWMAEEEERDSL